MPFGKAVPRLSQEVQIVPVIAEGAHGPVFANSSDCPFQRSGDATPVDLNLDAGKCFGRGIV